jgi:sulfoxide reductase heme-binding subunit YedZ
MTERSQRRRLLRHHVPLAAASLVVLALWMGLTGVQVSEHRGSAPSPTVPVEHAAATQTPGHQRPQSGQHAGQGATAAVPTHAPSQRRETLEGPAPVDRGTLARITTATGYVATGLLALTLLIGPANLVLGRRTPVSSYFRRDAGLWTAVFSVVHVVVGLQVHGPPGPALERMLRYFVGPDGQPLTDAFGLGNWTGLAATAVVLALLAISSDLALRGLKAGPWKWIQRLNYVLFALVVAHAIYYGALERTASFSTLLLLFIVASVALGQIIGISLWRRRSRLARGRAAAAA